MFLFLAVPHADLRCRSGRLLVSHNVNLPRIFLIRYFNLIESVTEAHGTPQVKLE